MYACTLRLSAQIAQDGIADRPVSVAQKRGCHVAVAERDLTGHAGPEGSEECGAVVRGAVARELRDEVRLGRGGLRAEDKGGVCERQTWVPVGEFRSRTVTAI